MTILLLKAEYAGARVIRQSNLLTLAGPLLGLAMFFIAGLAAQAQTPVASSVSAIQDQAFASALNTSVIVPVSPQSDFVYQENGQDADSPMPASQIERLAGGMNEMQSGMQKLAAGMEEVGKNLKVTTVDKNWGVALFGGFGYGIDDPLDSTLSAALPTRNSFVFGNLIWDVTKNLEIGVEIANWETDYTAAPALGPLAPGDNESMIYRTRVQLKF